MATLKPTAQELELLKKIRANKDDSLADKLITQLSENEEIAQEKMKAKDAVMSSMIGETLTIKTNSKKGTADVYFAAAKRKGGGIVIGSYGRYKNTVVISAEWLALIKKVMK